MLDYEFEEREQKLKTRHRLPVRALVKPPRKFPRFADLLWPMKTVSCFDENHNRVTNCFKVPESKNEVKQRVSGSSRKKHRRSRSRSRSSEKNLSSPALKTADSDKKRRLVRIPAGPEVEVPVGQRYCRVDHGNLQYLLRLRRSGEVSRVVSIKTCRKVAPARER